jgi:hypothetical protein
LRQILAGKTGGEEIDIGRQRSQIRQRRRVVPVRSANCDRR